LAKEAVKQLFLGTFRGTVEADLPKVHGVAVWCLAASVGQEVGHIYMVVVVVVVVVVMVVVGVIIVVVVVVEMVTPYVWLQKREIKKRPLKKPGGHDLPKAR
jgi:hypothetical protein